MSPQKKLFPTLILALVLSGGLVHAKDKAKIEIPALPGELRSIGGGTQIFLEGGRSLLWPSQGPLVLKGPEGAVLAQVNLSARASHVSGAEAMGLNVEEVDLGGALSQKKKYLNSKKAPTGRGLDASSLKGPAQVPEAGSTSKTLVQGVPFTITAFPNGASQWKVEWPGFTEDIFFDKKKSMVSDQQTRRVGAYTVTLKQFADGSFMRHYQNAAGAFGLTYDANDQSYRLVFANAEGETLSEWNCESTCAQDSSS
ncbi:MAG: hypothetical protein K8R69_11960 [Deltaproteobacteria bacterium]|nr:hypothetical protein [Deltaproteobacteria bacterium]